METEKATEAKEQEKRMDGRIIGITERGPGKYRLELMQEGLELPSPVWVNTVEAGGGKPKVKGGADLKIDDYVVVSYVNSKPYISHGKETVSRWVKGEIEVVDDGLMLGKSRQASIEEPSPEDNGFQNAGDLSKLDDVVSNRALVFSKYYEAIKQMLGRVPAGEECGFVSTLFIDHMKEHRICRKYGGDV